MAGPRGDRARRRSLAPAGVLWLRGHGGPAVLRYPPGSLVVIGGPPGAGMSWDEALAAWRADLRRCLAAGAGAVAVTTALRHGHRLGLARAAAAADAPAHLLMLDADAETCRAARGAGGDDRISDGLFEHLLHEWEAFRRTLTTLPDPEPFASIAVIDRDAADRLRRISV